MLEADWFMKDVDALPMETRIAVAAWVMKHIVDHAKDGGSFRYLIYDRLGLDMSAYVPLCADGMVISNEFDLNLKDDLIEALKGNDLKAARDVLGLCHMPGCWEYASTWSPQVDGTVALCSKHYSERGR